MNVYEIINTHNRIWSSREFVVFTFLLVIVVCIESRLFMLKKIRPLQVVAGLLLFVFITVIFGSTVFTRTPAARKYQLELFWSWKEIMYPTGRVGAVTEGGLLLENLLNMILLLPVGVLLPCVFGKKLKLWKGLLIGIGISCVIEFSQLVLGRGLFEFDDMIHNGFGCMLGTFMGNFFMKLKRWRRY